MKFRDKLYKKMKTAKSDNEYNIHNQNLKTYNILLRKIIREAKINFYNNKFETYKYNIKKSWEVLKSILNRNKNKHYPNLIENNCKLRDPKLIANSFNSYFVNVATNSKPNANAKLERNQYLNKLSNITFNFDIINESFVKEILNKLSPKISSGADNISLKMLKAIQMPLIPVLCLIVN